MRLSHSKLSTILSCPMSYYLSYVEGIAKKEEKAAFFVGSAIHWGIEHNTCDLTDYFNLTNRKDYTREMLLAEAVDYAYLKNKDKLFDEILRNNETGEKYSLLEEYHELKVEADLYSGKTGITHQFNGIIDLLLLTDKGFIVIDYKTSSYQPDWNNYLDQIYRYIFMLNEMFPDTPILKIGIINLRKTNIRQKKTENEIQFLNRLKLEYDINSDEYINYHEYPESSLKKDAVKQYIQNLAYQCDLAHMIDEKKIRFINFSAANGVYGKSDYWDIFYKTPDCYVLYTIRDHIWNDDMQQIVDRRDCIPIDMKVIDSSRVFNHYDYFKELKQLYPDNDNEALWALVKVKYDYFDKDLFDMYVKTYEKEMSHL